MTVRRIFHIMMGTDGGTERFFLRLSEAFHRRGIEQQFALRPDFPMMKQVETMGLTHAGYHLRRWPLSSLHAARMRRGISHWRPDVVMAWRAPAARLIPAKTTAFKLVRLGDYPRHLRHFRNVDCIVGNAPSVLSICADLGWQGQTSLISNFPSQRLITAVDRGSLATPKDAKLVVATGRFVASKGFDTLVRAIACTPDLWLWMVGDGEERPQLENLISQLGVADRVRLPGWVSSPQDYVAAADIYCMPSRKEPLGNVLLEGWQTGVPVVTTRSEGPDWAANDGKDVLMVEIDDVPALASALMRLAEDDRLAAQLVEAGFETLRRRFSETAIVDAYMNLFDSNNVGAEF